MNTARLIECDWPEFGEAQPPAPTTLEEYELRLKAVRAAMQRLGFTHMVVYGDREHFANLQYLTGYDPRFEEALLIVGETGTPLILVGNEGEGYLPVSPLHRSERLRHELYQPFSLLSQPRASSRPICAILADEGIGPQARVGCVGWKDYADARQPDATHASDLPAYLVDTLRALSSWEQVTNATAVFMSPADGLRARSSASEIAYFEYTGTLAAEAIKRMLFGLREGMSDHELAQLAGYNGVPLGCHMVLASGDNYWQSMPSPVGAVIRRGDPLSTNVCYWGSNVCRAGWVAASAQDLPAAAQDYVEQFAAPYFCAMARWFEHLRIGTPGGELAQLIAEDLPAEQFGITLNPGHLIHMDEWVSSPIYPGSTVPIRSGMVMQADVIPSSPVYYSTRMEDGYALADEALRQELAASYPACYARCQQRRDFMRNVLGIAVPDEVLPLTNTPGIVPPFFLAPRTILALA